MKKTKKILAVLLSTLLIGSAILTGCGSKESSADKKDKDPKEVTVGLSLSSLSNAFFIGMEKGVKDKTSEIGCKLIETNANGDIAKQLSDIEDLITKK